MKKFATAVMLIITGYATVYAQVKTLSLEEAVALGLQSSKQLTLAKHEVDKASAELEQAKDASLPTAKVTAGYSHALMLARSFYIPSSDGGGPKKLTLPFDNSVTMATLSISQPVFSGNQFHYARKSAALMIEVSKLNGETDKDEIAFNIISAYINYYKLKQNQKILAQNLSDIDSKLEEIKKFESQGLATRNDVLRFELEKSNMKLSAIELENNRKIVNYNLNILLGLADSTVIEEQDVSYKLDMNDSFENYLAQALKDRKELAGLKYQDQLSDININKVKDEKLPTLGVSGNLYYINPSKDIIPKSGTYLAPFMIGLNAGWDISSLYKNKNKLNEAKIQKQQVADRTEIIKDQIKTDVNKSYIQYKQALEKIVVLQDAITQATENERITESKFQNNLVTTTDRIDAQTLLYQSRINLELAKSDATAAYYALLKSTGHIQP
ncbi:TolC family protein [Terrimonas sp.]|uniref:TolC family protein n=1 Tax=Terrimonas sp. TaxID=1914338 RepID=UPI000D524EA5|nr:TolC family protein [Terrimonas sp.]PVD52079.1 TolC family protein [Terrimonas sp.]